MGLCRQPLVLGARPGCGQAGLCASVSRIRRRSQYFDRRRPWSGLVSARSWRSLHALLPGQPRLCGAGQCDQYRCKRHSRHQRLQRYNSNQRTNITYVNQRVNNGVTLVSRDTFVNARPVGRNLGHYDARQLAEAPVERSIQVQPVRTSVMGAGVPARFRPPQNVHQSPGSSDSETGSSSAALRSGTGGDEHPY